ncbi:MAG: hypothetical protein GF404_13925 [candidate division Zixibacteria bacterium]|nr:hypothetical protein [candidate division Zixibacteria bacterium]
MAMILDLKNLKEGVAHKQFELPADEFELNYEGVTIAGKLELEADVNRIKEQVVFKGRFSVPVRLVCARCAEEFDRVFSDKLVFVLNLVDQEIAESDEYEDTDDYYYLPNTTTEFDLAPLLREEVILQTGMKPLCSEDCAGICPNCGVNKNEHSCECDDEKIDPRWIKLKELTRKQN